MNSTTMSFWRNKEFPWLILLGGLCLLYIPTFVDLFRGIWISEEQGHGPIVLCISVWLIWRERQHLVSGSQDVQSSPWLAWICLFFGGGLYFLGRSQGILGFEVGSLIPMLMGCMLLIGGVKGVCAVWFGLFFMLFMVPLPAVVVDAITQPMKLAVSNVTEWLLYSAGYPIGRSGVILQIGQYQLLVADACAGLQTLFTLESMGLLYLNLIQHSSAFRNITLAILIIPISFVANVIRVSILTLVTYYLGDEAGQGFIHKFAGMVLYITALLLILGFDSLLRGVAAKREARAKA